MNDLKNLLEKALYGGPAASAPIDPADDLARGRSRLRQRRAVTLAGVAAVSLGLAVIPMTLNGNSTPASSNPPVVAAPAELPGLDLVAYQGEQIPGYQVDSTPKGWVIQGGDKFVLTIAPKNATDKDFRSFAGKLVVMLMSKDASPPTTGTDQPVDGRPGRLDVQGDTQILTYQAADERWMVIQAPTSLGWNGDRLAEFAADVKVLTNAEAGVG
jgi:hypothetical protein